MRVVVAIAGGACLLVALWLTLVRTGHPRAVAPVFTAIAGVVLLVVALLTGGHRPMPTPVTNAGSPSPAPVVPVDTRTPPSYTPPAVASTDAGTCTTGSPAASIDAIRGKPQPESLPLRIDGLVTTDGPVLRRAARDYTDATLPGEVSNVRSADYVFESDPNDRFIHVEIGTPTPGACAAELVRRALQNLAAIGYTTDITTLVPDPRIATYHVDLKCGTILGTTGYASCAWASSADAPLPVFGSIWVYPNLHRNDSTHLHLGDGKIGNLVDSVFVALTGGPSHYW